MNSVLDLIDIEKSFGMNRVLKGVTMHLQPGRVSALLGANGAGKSTLIKILSGIYPADGGEIRVAGEGVVIENPLDAARFGIQTVHQRIDETVVPGLSVAENLCFEEIVQGQVPAVRSTKRLLPRAREIADMLSLDWPNSKLRQDAFELGIADAQLLLLARALVSKPKILVLDEPTSTLSNKECDRLFEVIHTLRDQGVAILYVSHRLSEIRSLADDLVVLRDGRITDEQEAPFDLAHAVGSMLGQSVLLELEQIDERRGEETAITLNGVQLLKRSEPFDIEFRSGEVTGIVGLIGAGKSELARGIYGIEHFHAGTMELEGESFSPKSSADAVANGIFLVPEDRAAEAMLPDWSITHTATLPFMKWASRYGVVNASRERARAMQVIEATNVVAQDPEQTVDSLSGGNQQKVVVGRWLAGSPKIMLLDEPFRGVDIGARRDISHRVRDLAHEGACVVVLASDVDEILEVADRVIVLVEGQIALDKYTSEVDHSMVVTSMSEVA